MQLFENIKTSLIKNCDKNAFYINGCFYKYSDFAEIISRIRKSVQIETHGTEKNVGLVTNDDIETYSAIIALWFEGKAYVPISPETPKDRNESIIHQAYIRTIIDSSENSVFTEYNLIESKKLSATPIDLVPKILSDIELVYILFTSGTTGQPKGVPITRANLEGFINSFWKMGFDIDEKDRFLQMFELTFDLSVMSYLVPLLRGACIYTIPKGKVKYSYIYELMDEHQLTVALMVPSILHYLRPYFQEIDLPSVKYNLFCGEALPLDITQDWSKCLPNAKILNVYGPTEDTIFCTHYSFSRTADNKSHNGILSIGTAMDKTLAIIINDNNEILSNGNIGQLCLGGIQLTPGYWNNEERNKEAFFYIKVNNRDERFYKTGDLCICTAEEDIFYLGRLDSQIKIQGFRVELSEIEYHAKEYLKKINVVAVALTDAIGNTEIGLVIESEVFDIIFLLDYIKIKLPPYMIPTRVLFIDKFDLNMNGKIDRKKLSLKFNRSRNR